MSNGLMAAVYISLGPVASASVIGRAILSKEWCSSRRVREQQFLCAGCARLSLRYAGLRRGLSAATRPLLVGQGTSTGSSGQINMPPPSGSKLAAELESNIDETPIDHYDETGERC